MSSSKSRHASNVITRRRGAFQGRLTLFRGSAQPEGLAFDHDMGWGGLASGVAVHEIDGHHTDAYKEPSISRWISILRETLGQADLQSDNANPSRLTRRLTAFLVLLSGPIAGCLISRLL